MASRSQSKPYVNHLLVVIWVYVVILCNEKHGSLCGLLKEPGFHPALLNGPFNHRPAKMGV